MNLRHEIKANHKFACSRPATLRNFKCQNQCKSLIARAFIGLLIHFNFYGTEKITNACGLIGTANAKVTINWPALNQTQGSNTPFAGSNHMVRNKLHWDANDAVGLPKQRKVGLDW